MTNESHYYAPMAAEIQSLLLMSEQKSISELPSPSFGAVASFWVSVAAYDLLKTTWKNEM